MKKTIAATLTSLTLVPLQAQAAEALAKSSLPTCAQLAALVMKDQSVNDQQGALQGDRAQNDRKVLAATSEIVPAVIVPGGGSKDPAALPSPIVTHPAYCKITLKQAPMINVAIGLPLSAADGGVGGVQGAWNGRIMGLGGGGATSGNLIPVTPATDDGFVGTAAGTGLNKEWCNAINPATGKANAQKDCGRAWGWLLDPDNKPRFDIYGIYTEDTPLAQTLWGMELTRLYYGRESKWNYFAACQHGGGRQGIYLAQRYPQFYDGILTGADGYQLNRFEQGQQWAQVMAYTLPGHILAPEKSAAATAAAVKACESDYGVGLGIIGEPRRCKFDAKALICKGNRSDAATCLTSQEAAVINSIWDGPRNSKGERIWGGLPKGATFDAVLPKGGETYSYLITGWPIHATRMDPNWNPRELTPNNFEADFEKSYYTWHNLAKNWSTDNVDFDAARDGGTKIIHYYTTSDPLAYPFNSYTLVSRLFERYGVAESQKFFRTFYFPGNEHCGGGTGPQLNSQTMFDELRNWVEQGKAPDRVIAHGTVRGDTPISRPICKYPDEAVYNGSGSILEAKNFHCRVNMKEPADLAALSRTTHDYPEKDRKLLSEAPKP